MKPSHKTMIAAVLLAASAHACAADKITIMVSSIEKQIYLPAKLAEQLGYLKETGLDITLLSEPAGSSAEKEMLSGVAQGVIGFYDHTILLQARGKLAQCVVQFGQAPGEVLLVAKGAAGSIRSPADFRNRTLGVTGLGSSTHLLTQYLAARAGVRSSEFSIVPVGAGSRFIAAMAEGRIDAGMTTEPTVSRLLASGMASILVDLRTVGSTEAALGGSYPGACLYMSTAWINRHRDEVKRIVGAFVKVLRYIHTHSAAEIADKMPVEYYEAEKGLYVAALEAGKPSFTADGLMPENGPATVLKVLNGVDKSVRGKPINLDNTYTSEFLNAARP
jgi:NitT/TauT family transport system substrate-binding protein